MEVSFWHQKWEQGDIGFHQAQVNSLLAKHLEQLSLASGSRIFLPLCGMTRDISWLINQDFRIVGVELSSIAIDQLFKDLTLEPNITMDGDLHHYSAHAIDIFVDNIFDLSATSLGLVDAIYDRAALVALPRELRQQYAFQLINLTNAAPQLLITFEYDQSQMNGPPFSIDQSEIDRLYGNTYQLRLIEQKGVEGGLKGKVSAVECAWMLSPKC